MSGRPIIFVSSTGDLKEARERAASVLGRMGFHALSQDNWAMRSGFVVDLLEFNIRRSKGMVQLVGNCYGSQAVGTAVDLETCSFTALEGVLAERFKKKVVYLFIDPSYPSIKTPAESEEFKNRQNEYREKLKSTGRVHFGTDQEPIKTPEQLELRLFYGLDHLEKMRRTQKRVMALVVTLLPLILLLVGTVLFEVVRTRQQVNSLVAVAIDAAKRIGVQGSVPMLAQGQTRPEIQSTEPPGNPSLHTLQDDLPMSADTMSDAERIDRETQTQLADLRAPLDAAFKFLTRNGEAFYRAGEPDKAIAPFERAMALRPHDIDACNNLIVALTTARNGDITAQRQRAVQVAEATLKIADPTTHAWATTQFNLGFVLRLLPAGDPAVDIPKSIDAFTAALPVLYQTRHMAEWGITQEYLGLAWRRMPSRSKADHIRNFNNVIDASQKAVDALQGTSFQADLARAKINLVIANSDLHSSPADEQPRKDAIATCRESLNFFKKDTFPYDWAITHVNMANLLSQMAENRAQSLLQANGSYEQAAEWFSQSSFRWELAWTQEQQSSVLSQIPPGKDEDADANKRRSVELCKAAIDYYKTNQANVGDQARALVVLGQIYLSFQNDQVAHRLQAIDEWRQALPTMQKNDPAGYRDLLHEIADTWIMMPGNDPHDYRQGIEFATIGLNLCHLPEEAEDYLGFATSISWAQLLLGDYGGALKTVNDAPESGGDNFLKLETNHAHALLFTGQTKAAMEIYKKHIGETIADKSWVQLIQDDLNQFKNRNLLPPDPKAMDEVCNLFGVNPPDRAK